MVSGCGVAWSPSVTHNTGWLRSHSVTAGAGLRAQPVLQCRVALVTRYHSVCQADRSAGVTVQGGFSHTVSRQAPGSGFTRCHGAKWLGHLVSQSEVASVTQWQVPGCLISCCHSPGWLWSASVTACARLRAHPRVTAQGGLVTQCHSTCQAQGSHNVSGPGWLQSHGVMARSGLRAHPVSQHVPVWLLTWCHGAGCLVTGVAALRGAVTK